MKCVVCDKSIVGFFNPSRKIPYCSGACRDKYYRDMAREKTQDLIKKDLLDNTRGETK